MALSRDKKSDRRPKGDETTRFGGGGILPPMTMRMDAFVAPKQSDRGLGFDPDVEVELIGEPDGVEIDPRTGATVTTLDDGSVEVDFNPPMRGPTAEGAKAHDANLAEYLPESVLSIICEETLEGVEQDEQSRSTWLMNRAYGIKLLGFDIQNPQAQNAGSNSTTAVVGQSTVQHPLLAESVIGFNANATGELLPTGGPVKVENKTNESGQTDAQAEALEEDLNYYLTVASPEYYPDTDRLLLYVGFGGCGIKKVYRCPIRQRPVSESVLIEDFVVSNAAVDLSNAPRVTQIIHMPQSTMKRMQIAGAYRNVVLPTPIGQQPNAVEQQKAAVQGIDITGQQLYERDREFTVYEVYTELDIPGFEHKDDDGKPTGLRLPYRLAVDKDARKILEIRRNWAEDDERMLPDLPFVKYPFIPGLGFYDLGLLNVVGNTTNALTAAWRELLDAGMFANFPGFLFAKLGGRQNTNEMRVGPGSGVGIDTHGQPIGNAVMPLPYKTPDAAFMDFISSMAETGTRVGGTASAPVGEGKADAPVGTVIAVIEQATKMIAAVHRRLHRAQAQELQKLKQVFRRHPEDFIKAVKRTGSQAWDADAFLAALENAAVVPQADPDTPSHLHRVIKAMGLMQLDKQYQGMMDSRKVLENAISTLGYGNPQAYILPPQPAQQPPPDPKVIAQQLKNQGEAQKISAEQAHDALTLRMQQNESADQAAERQSREQLAMMKLREALIDHTQQPLAGNPAR